MDSCLQFCALVNSFGEKQELPVENVEVVIKVKRFESLIFKSIWQTLYVNHKIKCWLKVI
jgi:hypothetical protein